MLGLDTPPALEIQQLVRDYFASDADCADEEGVDYIVWMDSPGHAVDVLTGAVDDPVPWAIGNNVRKLIFDDEGDSYLFLRLSETEFQLQRQGCMPSNYEISAP